MALRRELRPTAGGRWRGALELRCDQVHTRTSIHLPDGAIPVGCVRLAPVTRAGRGQGGARERRGEHVKENLSQVLHQIAQDARAEGRFSHADLRAPGRPIDVNANVRTDTEQASFGAFVVASDWHRKLL